MVTKSSILNGMKKDSCVLVFLMISFDGICSFEVATYKFVVKKWSVCWEEPHSGYYVLSHSVTSAVVRCGKIHLVIAVNLDQMI